MHPWHAHLEGAQAQLEHESLSLADVLWGEGEDSIVDAKERDEQQGGSGQPPVRIEQDTYSGAAFWVHCCPIRGAPQGAGTSGVPQAEPR